MLITVNKPLSFIIIRVTQLFVTVFLKNFSGGD